MSERRIAGFADRRQAGRELARRLQDCAGRNDAVVLGLPRGGAVVADEVARALSLPLEVWCVRKIGVPFQAEVAMGAVASGGILLTDQDLVESLGLSPDEVRTLAEKAERELERREALYRRGRPPPKISGKTVIVVDDGVATGFTLRAALSALRRMNPARLVAAVPVCAPRSCGSLRDLADRIVCLLSPTEFYGISEWYGDFEQVSDGEVVTILQEGRARADRLAETRPGGVKP